MDVLAPSSGVLAQPTRARLFALLVEMKGSEDTEALAARLGLHPNGVRRHLERMRDNGLVERTRAQGGRGRPRDCWEVAPGARPGGERPEAYADLARWLTRAIPSRPDRLAEVERAGREIGRDLAPGEPGGTGQSGQAAERFRQVLTALGFQPEAEAGGDGSYVCRLRNCPYRDSVREDSELICTLHRGITAGLVAELDPDAVLKRFEPHDPEQAQCLVEVGGSIWGKAPGPERESISEIRPDPA